MNYNRIQRLIFSEYSDFEDMVLVESPFAETTRQGRGIRQVQVGLTPTKLILAADIIKPVCDYPVCHYPGRLDVEIECLELISVFPIELVSLSVFSRRKRNVLKAKFHDGNPNHKTKVAYFELGGSIVKRTMFWNLWCERVKFLNPHDKLGSSITETSVASSTSNSSLNVVKFKIGKEKIWQYYEATSDRTDPPQKWVERNLYFSDSVAPLSYCGATRLSISSLFIDKNEECQIIYNNQYNFMNGPKSSLNSCTERFLNQGKVDRINRFGEGVADGCMTGLYLPKISYSSVSLNSRYSLLTVNNWNEFYNLCEAGVEMWECQAAKHTERKHPRRYAFQPSSDINNGLGLPQFGKFEVKVGRLKKSCSMIFFKSSPFVEIPGLRNSTSYECLSPWVNNAPNSYWTHSGLVNSIPTNVMYTNVQNELQRFHDYLEGKNVTNGKHKNTFHKLASISLTWLNKKSQKINNFSDKKTSKLGISIWDLDSSTLASQLTIVEAELFSNINKEEFSIIVKQGSCKNAFNFRKWLQFSERISCLVASEVLKIKNTKLRARLITRFINTADKCNRLNNFQSCSNILSALQSPAVYRLHQTWASVRNLHSTKYELYEKLCRLYLKKRLFLNLEDPTEPFIPFASSLLCGKVISTNTKPSNLHQEKDKLQVPTDNAKKLNFFEQFWMNFNIFSNFPSSEGTTAKCVHHLAKELREETHSLLKCEQWLQASQAAVLKYSLQHNEKAHKFITEQVYFPHSINYRNSLLIEH